MSAAPWPHSRAPLEHSDGIVVLWARADLLGNPCDECRRLVLTHACGERHRIHRGTTFWHPTCGHASGHLALRMRTVPG